MSKNKTNDENEILDVSKTEQFIEKNSKFIIIGFIGLLFIAFAAFFINSSSSKKEAKVKDIAYTAQNYFSEEQWQLALDGDETNVGFISIAKNQKGSKLGNLANYYAGICYIKTGEFQNAVDYLTSYKATKDPNINGLVLMNLADAYMELDQKDKALSIYKKAANTESEVYQADFIYRYAMALQSTAGEVSSSSLKEAKKQFERIVKEFPNSQHARTAEYFIAAL